MEELEVEIDDATYGPLVFDVRTSGPPDGDPVLLLHGFPETSWSWRFQLDALAEAGFRCIAPDQRGYSPRARPEPVEAYSHPKLVGDVLAIAEALGLDRFHLVGHDWGGAVGWQLAGTHPQRLKTLSILSTPHPRAYGISLFGGDGKPPEGGGRRDASPDSDQAGRSTYVDYLKAEGSQDRMLADDAAGLRSVYQFMGMSEDEYAPYLAALGSAPALGAALNWYRAADLSMADGLGPITTPTLYIWSTEDPALGRDAAEATGRCVSGPYRFVVLEGVGHWIAEQAPADVNRLLLEQLRS